MSETPDSDNDFFPSPLVPPVGDLSPDERYSYILRCLTDVNANCSELNRRVNELEEMMDELMEGSDDGESDENGDV